MASIRLTLLDPDLSPSETNVECVASRPCSNLTLTFASIVFVHGLQGHAQGTWTYDGRKRDEASSAQLQAAIARSQEAEIEAEQRETPGRSRFKSPKTPFFSTLSRSKANLGKQIEPSRPESRTDKAVEGETGYEVETRKSTTDNPGFFWPRNLPEACAHARVMAFGYDSNVSKFFSGATNKNTFYDHAGDLLGALVRKRIDLVGDMK